MTRVMLVTKGCWWLKVWILDLGDMLVSGAISQRWAMLVTLTQFQWSSPRFSFVWPCPRALIRSDILNPRLSLFSCVCKTLHVREMFLALLLWEFRNIWVEQMKALNSWLKYHIILIFNMEILQNGTIRNHKWVYFGNIFWKSKS